MLGLDGSFMAAAAFVCGCDAGNSFRLLDGFREWLASKIGDGANLSWQSLVLRCAFPSDRFSAGVPRDEDEEAIATETLFELIEEFFEIRQNDGLMNIFIEYAARFERKATE